MHLGNEMDGEPWRAIAMSSDECVSYDKDDATIMYFVNRASQTSPQPFFIATGSSWMLYDGEPAQWVK